MYFKKKMEHCICCSGFVMNVMKLQAKLTRISKKNCWCLFLI